MTSKSRMFFALILLVSFFGNVQSFQNSFQNRRVASKCLKNILLARNIPSLGGSATGSRYGVRMIEKCAISGGKMTALHMVRMTLDMDNNDTDEGEEEGEEEEEEGRDEQEVTYLNEEELRAFWQKSGMSPSSYNEDMALSKMLLADNDDDDDDGDNDDGDYEVEEEEGEMEEEEEMVVVNKKQTISEKKRTFLQAEKKRTFLTAGITNSVKTTDRTTAKTTDKTNDKAVLKSVSEEKVEKIEKIEKKPLLFKKLLNRPKNTKNSLKSEENEDEEESNEEGEKNVLPASKNILPASPQDLPDSSIPAGRSVGIDLGTTNSAISIIEGGKPVIIPVNGGRILPSIVGYDKQGRVIVGEKARRQHVVNPKNTFSSVKRIIGRSIKELSIIGEKLSTHKIDKKHIKKEGYEEISINCPNLERNISPIEVSSEILKNLISEATAYLGGEVITKAVITVPAYFLPAQCEATIKAGEAAGLLKIKLLREPEAAALAYGLTQRDRQIVLVFDLGGGTFDVSVLEVGNGFIEVIATSGDAHLGGDDFDALIVDWLIDQYATTIDKEQAKTFLGNPIISSRLFEAAESAKFALSAEPNITISIPFIFEQNTLNCVLTRRKFEQLSKGLLQRLLNPLRQVAIMAGVNLPGESGQLGINEDLFFSGADEVENSGVVDLRRNDGISRKMGETTNTGNSNSGNGKRDRGNKAKGGEEEDEGEEGEGDDLADLIRSERSISDAAYRAGSTISPNSPPLMSIADLKKQQLGGRNNAKEMKKVKGSTTKELRRLQKEMKDSSLASFPGGQALDDVILVGGSTRIPAVQRLVKVITGVDPRRTVNPDEAVSLGAAVMAGILDGDITDMQVMSAWQAAMYRAFYEDYRKTENKAR